MSTQTAKRVLVVAGLGNGIGTGAATARLFAKNGYSVALVARGANVVNNLATEINTAGGHAAPFALTSYSHEDIISAWNSIHAHFPKPEYTIRAVVFNVGHGVWKPILEVTQQDVQDFLQTTVAAAFAFSRGAILAFKDNKELEETTGKRGTLIFTGATAALRGNIITSAFAPGKFGVRALSQSLAKEFGPENIHVAHSVIDGAIRVGPNPDKLASHDNRIKPESIASSYLYLVNQNQSAMTWELDLRHAQEKW